MKFLLSPHNDDETLFAAFTILREKPRVIICLQSDVEEKRGEGVTAAQRNDETIGAIKILGSFAEFLPFSDDKPNWDGIEFFLKGMIGKNDTIYAPAVEPGGHFHHNAIGAIAKTLFKNVVPYMTYTTAGKSTGKRVPFEPEWPLLKLRALACYESQITRPLYVDHFLREQYEYYAET